MSNSEVRKYIVCVPEENGVFHAIPADSCWSTAFIENKLAVKNAAGTRFPLKEIAYVIVDADSKERAAAQATVEKLTYIPKNIIVGMQTREPGISMRSIRQEFARRVADYETPSSPKSASFSANNPFADLLRHHEKLFGKDSPFAKPSGPR